MTAKDVPTMGIMSGAMIMAPMMMAGEAAAMPPVATTADSTMHKKNEDSCLSGSSTTANTLRSIRAR